MKYGKPRITRNSRTAYTEGHSDVVGTWPAVAVLPVSTASQYLSNQ